MDVYTHNENKEEFANVEIVVPRDDEDENDSEAVKLLTGLERRQKIVIVHLTVYTLQNFPHLFAHDIESSMYDFIALQLIQQPYWEVMNILLSKCLMKSNNWNTMRRN